MDSQNKYTQIASEALNHLENENKRLITALRELDTGGGDYMTVREKIAKLSGYGIMAVTVDDHLEIIRKKIEEKNNGSAE